MCDDYEATSLLSRAARGSRRRKEKLAEFIKGLTTLTSEEVGSRVSRRSSLQCKHLNTRKT